jgi:hypothetical protein
MSRGCGVLRRTIVAIWVCIGYPAAAGSKICSKAERDVLPCRCIPSHRSYGAGTGLPHRQVLVILTEWDPRW